MMNEVLLDDNAVGNVPLQSLDHGVSKNDDLQSGYDNRRLGLKRGWKECVFFIFCWAFKLFIIIVCSFLTFGYIAIVTGLFSDAKKVFGNIAYLFYMKVWLYASTYAITYGCITPFAIQVTAITLLIISAAKSRARTRNNHATTFTQILRKQFKTQKELYVTPTIIILAALPQIIITSSFACTELNNAWQRYALLVSYLFSFTPQIFGFLIYVLPSSSYKTEFINTKIGRKLFRIKINNQNNNRTNVVLATKQHKTKL
ncbi:unnamed protein product [Adineta steineri]|uniref:Uncharacterized protein n=1 Tax=Adineta steineri TaxID=433720 RepID=A0A819MIT5_9BILA|nr:unnamed protein product [Adineta steineri]